MDVLVNGAPFVNGVDQAPMPRELADSEQTVDQRRYWPTVRNSGVLLDVIAVGKAIELKFLDIKCCGCRSLLVELFVALVGQNLRWWCCLM
jgi:hypothetical protein